MTSKETSDWEVYFDTSPGFDGFPRLTPVWVNKAYQVDLPSWYVRPEEWGQKCLEKKEGEQ